MDLKKKVIRSFYWNAGGKLLCQFITWVITLFVIRLLTPADYGLMAMAGIFIGLLSLLNELGLGAAIVQRENLDNTSIRKVFGLVITVNTFLFILLLFTSPLIASFFNEPKIIPVLRLLSFQFILMGLSIIPHSLLMREMDFKNISIIEFISGLIGSLTTLIIVLMNGGVWALVFGNLTSNLIRAIGLNMIHPWVGSPRLSFKGMRQIMSFGGYVTIGSIFWYFYNQADIFIVGKLLGKNILGFYSIGLELASIPMNKISGILNQIAFPAYSIIKREPEKVKTYFLKSIRIISFIAFPVLWGISSISEEIVVLFLGEKWQLAALPLQLISLLIPLRMVSNITYPVLIGLGKPDIAFLNILTYAVVMPLAMLIGVKWGIIGVCLAWLIVFPIVFMTIIIRVNTILNIKFIEFITSIHKPIIASLIMYLMIMAIKYFLKLNSINIDIELIIILIIIGFIIYSSIIFIINKEGYGEMKELLKI